MIVKSGNFHPKISEVQAVGTAYRQGKGTMYCLAEMFPMPRGKTA